MLTNEMKEELGGFKRRKCKKIGENNGERGGPTR
jgi:hypothetical protein